MYAHRAVIVQTIPASPNEDVQKQILRELAFNRECRADWITRYYGAFLEDVCIYNYNP